MRLFKRKPKTRAGQGAARPGLSREEALALIPVKNLQVAVEELPDGLLRLSYPTTVKPWFSGLARRAGLWNGQPLIKRLDLDLLGCRAFALIDGTRPVRKMIEAFAADHGLGRREAELSLTAFLRELGRRGIIAFKDPA